MNIDNYLKILLIIQRKRSRLPVILMGESGCGKTFLLRYVAEILFKNRVEFFSFILYYGVKEDDFIQFMDNMIEIASNRQDKDIWIFFDEFNTSELQSIICELLFDRVFSISKKYKGIFGISLLIEDEPLPQNIFFVAACNPFKMRKINPNNEDDVVNVHPDMKNLLSHRVFPLPTRILGYLWDYGSLNENSEKSYIKSMISKLKLKPEFQNCLVKSIVKSQKYIKEVVEKRQSSVSLRDIKRVVKIFHFFACYVKFRSRKEHYLIDIDQMDIEEDDKAKEQENNQEDEDIKETKEQENKKKPENKKTKRKKNYKDFDEFYENEQFDYMDMSDEDFVITYSITLIVNYIFRISKECNIYLF